eukprot:TRINITY_DN26802_c0_g1_i9.p2 TRINITY_DN26802_c0_g1~~TRINITY_DN26802_c0_g1_i9.p2  ORF type:complete len:112 (+),score=20.69 TRINITY_DN26802_c0_g1_i9:205-540(+)
MRSLACIPVHRLLEQRAREEVTMSMSTAQEECEREVCPTVVMEIASDDSGSATALQKDAAVDGDAAGDRMAPPRPRWRCSAPAALRRAGSGGHPACADWRAGPLGAHGAAA